MFELSIGHYVGLTARLQCFQSVHIELYGQYALIDSPIKETVGPTDVEFDASGWSVGGGISIDL